MIQSQLISLKYTYPYFLSLIGLPFVKFTTSFLIIFFIWNQYSSIWESSYVKKMGKEEKEKKEP